MPPAMDEQLSWLPYSSPANVVLRAARLLRRIERIAPELYPSESIQVIEDISLTELRLDRVEAALKHRVVSWSRFVASKSRWRTRVTI